MRTVAELRTQMEALPASQREELEKAALAQTAGMAWVPNPGPQTAAYNSLADELLYGGEVGGGKTDLLLGLALTAHKNSLLLRRFTDDARGIAKRATEIVGHSNGLNKTLLEWPLDGRFLEFGGCKVEDDKQRYKGRAHDLKCVEAGTLIRMGDGYTKPIETILAGDMVATLEGPRRVERKYPAQWKPCVSVEAVSGGRVVASQIQSNTHALLTDAGWLQAGALAGACVPTQFHADGKPSRLFGQRFSSLVSNLAQRIGRSSRMAEPVLRWLGLPPYAATTAGAGGVVPGTYFAEFVGLREEILLLPEWSGLSAPTGHPHGTGGRDCVRSSGVREGFGVRTLSGFGGWLGRCLFGTHRHGGHTRPPLGLSTYAAVAPKCFLLPSGAVQPTPNNSLGGVWEQTQTRNPRRRRYSHPYTKETRLTDPIYSGLDACSLRVTDVGVREVHDIQVAEVRHYITDAGFINQNCFDELADFTLTQYLFIITWLRTIDPNQRVRVVAGSNPPTTAEGTWILERWGAWLDPEHPNHAEDGELRWYVQPYNQKELEVVGPGPHGPYMDEKGEEVMLTARSRTFIRSSMEDNPNYVETGYAEVLNGLTGDLRQAYRQGDFTIGLNDKPQQLIPSAWIKAAQLRWRERPPEGVPMCTLAADPAQGGPDESTVAFRHDAWFGRLLVRPGKETPLGSDVAGMILATLRDNAIIVIDMGGGYGAAPAEHLESNNLAVVRYNGAEKVKTRTEDRKIGYMNRRAEAHWTFRMALDPSQPGGSPVALPPDNLLVADLAAPTFTITSRGVQIESKESIRKRLGRSTDRGDSVIMCWFEGPHAITAARQFQAGGGEQGLSRRRPTVILGRFGKRKTR